MGVSSDRSSEAVSAVRGVEPSASSSEAVGRTRYELPRDIEEVELAFIRCHALERREPGGGKWPFAGDGPWHLAQGEVGDIAGDFSETLIVNEAGKELRVRKVEAREPKTPLSSAEVDELALLRGWLQLVPDAPGQLGALHDRKLVWLATGRLHAGEGRVPWTALKGWMRSPRSPDALVRRYRMALAVVACRLNGWPERRARVMAG